MMPLRLLGFLVLTCGFAACSRPHAADQAPPLILISIDTLRADHLPAYGYTQVETPVIDAFRRDAVLFEAAYSPVPLTLPAHSSMLTGLLPPDHGVRVNVGYPLAALRLPFVPRLLKERGYATGGAVSSFVLHGNTGMKTGFDFYDDKIEQADRSSLLEYQRPGLTTLAATLPWLAQQAKKPLFLFFHIYEPHAPYQPPAHYAARYRLPYDGEVAFADEIVGKLLAELKRLGLYDRAAIVLTSDHGDGLGEHGEEGHGVLLYRSTLHVPLLLKLPGQKLAGAKVATPVQLSDIAPTLLTLAGAPQSAAFTGRDLVALAESAPEDRSIYAETYYTRLYFGWSELRALIDSRHQYIDSSAPELYDLAADPGQLRNVLAEKKREAAQLRDQLAAIPPQFDPPGTFDLEVRKKLESLGYLGGARSRFTGALPPPQTQLELVAALSNGYREFSSGRYLKAAEIFREVLAKNDQSLVAWENLAMSLERSGQWAEALVAYQETMKRAGNEPHLALAMGELLLLMGRHGEAQAHAELALSWDGAAAQELIARVALASGQLDPAERAAQAGLAIRPTAGLKLALARVLRQRGEAPAALALAEEAAALAGAAPPKGLDLLRGDLLAREGRLAEAEEAFRREMGHYPREFLAVSNLAMLYAATERKPEAVALLRESVRKNPVPMAYVLAVNTLNALGEARLASQLATEAKGKFPKHPGVRSL